MKGLHKVTLLLFSTIFTPIFAGREEAIQKLENETISGPPASFFSGIQCFDDSSELETKIKNLFDNNLKNPSLETIIILESTPTALLPALYLLQQEGYTFNYYGFNCANIAVDMNDSLQHLFAPEENIVTLSDLKLLLQSQKTENSALIIGLELPNEINKYNRKTIASTLDSLTNIIKEYAPKKVLYAGSKINYAGHGLGDKKSRIALKEKEKQLYSVISKDNPSLYVSEKIENSTDINLVICSLYRSLLLQALA